MNDNNKAEENVVETDTTQVDSPTTENPITGGKTDIKVSDDQGTVIEESNSPVMQTEEERRAFQEMRLENKRLREELETKGKSESAFNLFRAQTPPTSQQGTVRIENYQDPLTGETNWQAYNLAQQQREQQILAQARFEAQQTTSELLDEERARSKYSELFNDPITEKQIASRWFYEKAQGNNVSISDIAGEFARNFKQAVSKAEKVGAERVLNEVKEKEKASLAPNAQTTNSQRVEQQNSDLQGLRVTTRFGGANAQDAITARLSQIPWANK